MTAYDAEPIPHRRRVIRRRLTEAAVHRVHGNRPEFPRPFLWWLVDEDTGTAWAWVSHAAALQAADLWAGQSVPELHHWETPWCWYDLEPLEGNR